MNTSVFGIDIAKQVFQIHWVDQETGEIHSDKVKRKDFFDYVSHQLFWLLWRWAVRRHPTKNKDWVRRKYYLNRTGGW